jgi:hypothetical protein
MDMDAVRSLRRWDTLTTHAQEALARAIGERLPATFAFVGISSCALAEHQHQIASFDYLPDETHDLHATIRFALLPGDEVTLGYDRERPFAPDADHLASWQAFARPWLHDPHADLQAYLSQWLTPLRHVTIPPFLLETAAVPLEVPIPIGEQVYPYTLSATPTYRTTEAAVSAEGFRLPTPDEWEYACSAGARTLWRWGDWCPSVKVWETASPPVGTPAWDLHLRPNAFGLQIARAPEAWEFTATLGRMRGGDGGNSLQTEAFIQWLTLASSFDMRWEEDADAAVYGGYLRRAYSLDASVLN